MLSAERNSRAHGSATSRSPSRTSNDQKALTMWKQQLTAYVAWVNSQLKKKAGAHLVEDLRHDIRDGVALVDLVEVIGGEVLEGVHTAPSTYVEMKENVDKVLHFMMEKHIKNIVEGNLKAIMRLILALAAHYKPNSVRHSSQASTTNAPTTTATTTNNTAASALSARQQPSNLNIAGIAQGAAAALTEARRTANKAGHRHRRRRQKEDPQWQQQHHHHHQYENQSCSDSDYGTPQQHHHHHHQHHQHHSHHHQQQQHPPHHHRNSYPSSSSYSKTVKAEHGFSRSTSLMSSSVPTPRHHPQTGHTIGLTASHSYQRALGEGEEGGGATRGDLEGASGSSSPVNSISSPGISLYMSDPPSSMEPIIDSSGALMSASCESDSLTDSGFLEIVHTVKDAREALFSLHSLLLTGETQENGESSASMLDGSNPQEKMCVLKGRLLNAEEMSQSLKTELNKAKKEWMEMQATKLGLEQRLSEQETQLSSAKGELLTRELDSQQVLLEMESLRKQLVEKDQLLNDVKASYVKQEEDKDKVMNELRKEVIKRDQSIEVLQENLSHHDKTSAGSRKNSVTCASSVANGERIKEPSGIPTTRPGKLDMYVRRASIARPKHLSELESVRDSLRAAKSSTGRSDVTLTLETLEGHIISLMDKLNSTSHSNNTYGSSHTEGGGATGREYPRPWQQGRPSPSSHPHTVKPEAAAITASSNNAATAASTTTTFTTPGKGNRGVAGSGIARSRLNQQAPPFRRSLQQQDNSVIGGVGSKQTDHSAPSSSGPASKGNGPAPSSFGPASKGSGRVNGQTPAAAKAGSRVKTPSPTNATTDLNHNNHHHHHQQQQQQQQLPPTQVLYYMEDQEKPFACSIHKRLGEITLRDFKSSCVEESSLSHFFFKAQDPEYGTVKEELFNDEDILPGWEGRIVAWVVEAEGTVC